MEIEYKLYTDASRRKSNGVTLCVIAGVILGEKNKPVLEFIWEQPDSMYSEELEMKALQVGLEAALQMNIKTITCFIDNLNTVKILKKLKTEEEILEKEKGWKNLMSNFDNFMVNHVPREFNVYANALAKYPFNIRLKGNPPLAYHGINRSKKRFYTRMKDGLTEDVHNFQAKSNASVYLKFKTLRDLLEKISDIEPHKRILRESNKMDKMFKQFYTYFHTVLYTKKNTEVSNIREDNPEAFLDFLKTTEIKQTDWPVWLLERINKPSLAHKKM